MMTRNECLQISGAIADKWGPIANARGPLLVPLEARTVLLVSNIGAVIDNGGFDYLLEGQWTGDEDLQQSIAAFRRIGCEEAGNIVSFVTSHFLLQGGSTSLDPEAQRSALDAAFPAEARNELSGRFWDQRQQIEEKLAAYVFANKAQIEEQLRLDLKSYGRISQ